MSPRRGGVRRSCAAGGRRPRWLPGAFGFAAVVLLLTVSVPGTIGAAPEVARHAPHAPDAAAQGLGPSPSAPTSAQDLAWSQAATSYSIGEGGGLAWSDGTSEAVLFGGLTSSLSNTTSIYNEASDSWSASLGLNAPSPREHFAFAANGPAGEDVLFGGETNTTLLYTDNETWIYYEGNQTWRQVAVGSTAPTPRQDAAFATAPYVGVALLFGGWNQSFGGGGTLIYGDTWLLDLATDTWSKVSLGAGSHPPNLHGASLLWDPVVHRFDLFGGCDPCQNALWRFDPWNLTWTQMTTTNTPPGRGMAVWAFDPVQDLDVLFAGENSLGVLNDAYSLNVTTLAWTTEVNNPAPAARYAAAATWMRVAQNETLLVAGGNSGTGPLNDLWRFAPTCNLTVQLQDASTHLPLDRGTVVVDRLPSVQTNAQGFANVTEVPPGGTVVSGSAVAYNTDNVSLYLRPALPTHLIVLDLVPVPMGNVRIHVATPLRVPIAGADVNITVGGQLLRSPPLTTDALGWANYSGVPSQVTLVIVAWTTGAHANKTLQTVGVRGNLTWNLTLYPLPELVVRAWGTNDPTDPAASYALPGATVWFNGSTVAVTGANGYLNVTFNHTGALVVMASLPGYTTGWGNTSVPYTGTVATRANLTAEETSTIRVNASYALTGAPFAGVLVNDSYSNGLQNLQTSTDSAGWSNTTLLRSGPNALNVWTTGYYAQALRVFVYPGEVVWLNASMVSLPILNLQAHGIQISGQEVPLAAANIFYNGEYSGMTGPQGWLNFTPARAGTVRLYATETGYRPGWTNLTVASSGVQWANITLRHLAVAWLDVQVLDRDDGLPIVAANVNATLPEGVHDASTNAQGLVNFTDAPGPGYAGASAAGFYPTLSPITLKANRSVTLTFRLVPYPVLVVQVLGTNDTLPHPLPIDRAEVLVNGTLFGATNAQGYDNISSLPGGLRLVEVEEPLFFADDRFVEFNYTGPTNATFILPERSLTTIRVHVADLLRRSVPFAAVNLTNLDAAPTTFGGSEVTGTSGWLNFTGIGPGNYSLTAYHSGYQVWQFSAPPGEIVVPWVPPGGVIAPLVEYATLLNNPWVGVYAWATSLKTGEAIDGALFVLGESYGQTTNLYGNATFSAQLGPFVPGGTYEVEASAIGYYDWFSVLPMAFFSGGHTNVSAQLKPTPPGPNCTTPSLCPPNQNGTATKGNFSLLPFATGPWWPFFVLPPIFLLGALVYFVITRQRTDRQRPPPGVVLVAPPPASATEGSPSPPSP